MKLMSYNVATGTPSAERAAQMIGNILNYDADIVGTQEVNTRWIKIFEATGLLNKYGFVGKPRGKEDDFSNGNEYSAILYKKDKLNLIVSGTLWVSETPNERSVVEGSAYPRIMTYGVFEDKATGKRFMHVNTHIDYCFPANTIQMGILIKLRKYIGYEDLPTFYTGDFNMTNEADGYRMMLTDANTDDARLIAVNKTEFSTIDGSDSVIDFCFMTKGDFKVNNYLVKELPGSDHNPVHIDFDFAK